MNQVLNYKTDSSDIELIVNQASNPKAIFLIWPCTMGDVKMYRVPVDEFAEKGYTTIQYNPRSHGNSSGQFDILNAVKDIDGILSDYNEFNFPIVAIGHSGGCGGLLKLGKQQNIKKFYFCAPVFDSIESLSYMYENGYIKEFVKMISSMSDQTDFIESILKNKQWLDGGYWKDNDLKERLNSISNKLLIGSFLDGLFIKGVNTKNEFADFSKRIELLLPEKDKWYPLGKVCKTRLEGARLA